MPLLAAKLTVNVPAGVVPESVGDVIVVTTTPATAFSVTMMLVPKLNSPIPGKLLFTGNGPLTKVHEPTGTVIVVVGYGNVVVGSTGAIVNVNGVPAAMVALVLQSLRIAGRYTKFVNVISAVVFLAGITP